MGSNFLWLVLVTLVSLERWSCHGCVEQEKLALLHLKPLFSDSHLALKSWSKNDSSDCCRWNRVKCNTTTGRVIRLSLSQVSSRVLYLNSSLFLPFEELKSLDLSGNQIVGFFGDKGFRGQQSNVEFLDLGDNKLNESIFSSLGRFPSLKSLNLQANAFSGKDTKKLSILTSLEILDLGDNTLNCSILKSIENLTSLKVLSIRNCGLAGALPAKGLCELTHLKTLDISNNNLCGNLPSCFSNLTSLKHLDVSSNQFSGNIAQYPFQSLTSIQNLELSHNQFQIPSSLRPFLNLSNLKTIYGEKNQVYDDRELYSSVPKFQLNTIHLSCCGNGGALPKFLYHQHDLQEVYLSDINLSGNFPNWLLENNTGLQTLNLRNNSLSGPWQMPFQSHKHLSSLDVSENLLHGYIEYDRKIGTFLPRLTILDISRNSFIGGIPSSFGDMKSLYVLDASNNKLSGEIPEHFAIGCQSLSYLILSNNQLDGQMLPPKSTWKYLVSLHLDGNHFSGNIPESLLNISLIELDINDNYLSGTIPRWIGNMTYLQAMSMANNEFEGPIPLELCQLSSSLTLLDLSGNKISGSLPDCPFPEIGEIRLYRNRLEGPLKDTICNGSRYLTELDLSNNYFTGKIPDCFDKLQDLSFLLLNRNKLEGEIPTQLCKLRRLSMIDVSHNNLSGRIPACLHITSLNEVSGSQTLPIESLRINIIPIGFTAKNLFYFYQGSILYYMSGIDLSHNRLTGEIPREIGNLSRIRALNISHNSLTGPIPPTLSKLGLIESLDLSYNNLRGEIPPQLVNLYSLSSFSVAYNNLSGKTPARIRQFATFEESSYKGNPFLCGEPLPTNCSATAPEAATKTWNGPTDVGLIDMGVFSVSFIASYIVVLLSIAAVLYINPYWRQAWFYYIEMGYSSCYDFVVDHFP